MKTALPLRQSQRDDEHIFQRYTVEAVLQNV